MSKATKKEKHVRRVAPRRRHPRRSLKGRTPNPAFGISNNALLDVALEQSLLSILRMTGIMRAFRNAVLNGGSVAVDTGGPDEFDGAEGSD